MRIRRVVPNLRTEQITESREFYVRVLGMEVGTDLGWMVNLRSTNNPTAQIQLLTHDEGAPLVPDLTIEVEDVDAVHAEVLRSTAKVVYPLTNEPWGVRRFFVQDPSGAVVNVMTHRGDQDVGYRPSADAPASESGGGV